jgi:hypothetical protein
MHARGKRGTGDDKKLSGVWTLGLVWEGKGQYSQESVWHRVSAKENESER